MIRAIRLPSLLAALLCFQSAWPPALHASTSAPAALTDFRAQAARLLAEQVPHPRGPGVSVLVARGETVLFRDARGMASVELEVPLRPEHVMRIASLTKQFTAAGLLRLVDEGRVSLDDPLSKYLPGYPGGEGITLSQLLNHTSGVRSYTRMSSHMEHALHRSIDTPGLIDVFSGQPPEFAPGSSYAYNDSGYVLAGAVIEQVTGLAWDAWLGETFFQPLGLAHTRGGNSPVVVPGLASGYRTDRDDAVQPASYLHMSHPHAAGALLSNVDDLWRWSRALHEGEVLSKASYTRMIIAEGPAAKVAAPYGYGLEVSGEGRQQRIEHTGWIIGYVSALVYLPEDKITVAVIRNATGPGDQGVQDLAKRLADLARGIPAPGEPAPPAVPMAELLEELDAKFFAAFNDCDVEAHIGMLDPALEFFHDKGGRALGAHRMEAMMRERCASPASSLRRELVSGSLQVHPLPGFGAIQEGEHRFHLTVGDQPEQWVESARFVHVWRQDASGWRIVRALSFDHQAP
jgi:D-alanyl-D-alanine carboxypeptidase